MSWKTTLAAGAFFAVIAGYYMLSGGSTPPVEPPKLPVCDIPLDRMARIDITIPGRPEIVLEQQPDVVTGIRWRVTKPIQRLANEPLILDMGQALIALRRSGSIKPGDPRYNLRETGLESPAVAVGVGDGTRKILIRFGAKSNIDRSLRYFMVEGDETIYVCPESTTAPFERSLYDLRNKGLARFEPIRGRKLELTSRYIKPKPVIKDGKPVYKQVYTCDRCGQQADKPGKCSKDSIEYRERTVPMVEEGEENDVCLVEFRDTGLRGWYLVQRNGRETEEHLDDARVVQAITLISNSWCHEFIEKGDPAKYKLDKPELKYRIWLQGVETPIEVALSSFQEEAEPKVDPKKMKRVVAARVAGTDEIGIMEPAQYDALYRHINQMRARTVFETDKNHVRSVRIATRIGDQDAVLDIRNLAKIGQPPAWVVHEPKMASLSSDELERNIIERILSLEVRDWWPMQEDLSLFGLGERPDVKLTVEIQRTPTQTETVELRFGNRGHEDAYLLRPKAAEICIVPADYVKNLDRVELLAQRPEMFSCPRKDLIEISVDMQAQGPYAPVFYRLGKDDGGNWMFKMGDVKDPVDPSALSNLLALANYIEAEAYITRRPEFAAQYNLASPKPPSRLFIKYKLPDGKTREVALHISQPQTGSAGGELYFAKFYPMNPGESTADPKFQTVFRVKRQLVDLMRKGVKKESKPDEGTNPDRPPDKHHDDDHEKPPKDKPPQDKPK